MAQDIAVVLPRGKRKLALARGRAGGLTLGRVRTRVRAAAGWPATARITMIQDERVLRGPDRRTLMQAGLRGDDPIFAFRDEDAQEEEGGVLALFDEDEERPGEFEALSESDHESAFDEPSLGEPDSEPDEPDSELDAQEAGGKALLRMSLNEEGHLVLAGEHIRFGFWMALIDALDLKLDSVDRCLTTLEVRNADARTRDAIFGFARARGVRVVRLDDDEAVATRPAWRSWKLPLALAAGSLLAFAAALALMQSGGGDVV